VDAAAASLSATQISQSALDVQERMNASAAWKNFAVKSARSLSGVIAVTESCADLDVDVALLLANPHLLAAKEKVNVVAALPHKLYPLTMMSHA
jgi:hypothetical protein